MSETISNKARFKLVLCPQNSPESLLEFLRDNLKLKGTVEGCSVGVCGSCTVLIDGKPVSSASRSRATSKTKKSRPSRAYRKTAASTHTASLLKHQAFQCGFCTTGMIMAVKGLLNAHPHPSEERARDYLSGNLCRCGTCKEVLAAVAELAKV
jgi:aerobic-type carbon monoxide dehydrogenase small subunit (CoxS/CutS family)